MMAQQSKPNVLVTGASGGVGVPLVGRLEGLGYRVFAGVRREEDGRALVARGREIVPVILDITDEQSVEEASETVERMTGRAGLHGLVNNAGLIVQGPLELVSTEALRRQFEVNVVGQIAVTRAFLPLLRRAEPTGRVVNVGAATGRVALPFLGPISASKAAMESLTDALRMELKHLGVEVSIVEPGAMQTEIFAKSVRAAEEDIASAPADVRELYAPAMAATAEVMSNQSSSPADVAVEAIVRALTDRNPKTRYAAGRDAGTLMMLRRLPDRARDRVLMNNMGLKAEAFRPPVSARATGGPRDTRREGTEHAAS
jgi:NAD(P)-dependent dehydrogenase (short-subunit alcohol dehydrogenase family)